MSLFSLEVQVPERPKQSRGFEQETVVVGRRGVDLVVADHNVSSRHGEFRYEAGNLTYRDLGSTNGSYLGNGEAITKRIQLAEGQRLRLGHTTIVVKHIGTAGLDEGSPTVQGEDAPDLPSDTARRDGEAEEDWVEAAKQGVGGEGSGSGRRAAGSSRRGAEPELGADVDDDGDDDDADEEEEEDEAGEDWISRAKQGASSASASASRAWKRASAGAQPGTVSLQDMQRTCRRAASRLEGRWSDAAMLHGIVMVPVAILSWLFAFIPAVGPLLVTLVQLAGAVGNVLAAGALGIYALHLHVGRPIDAAGAWTEAVSEAGEVGSNLFVAGLITMLASLLLIVPGIAVGCFMIPIFFVERERFLEIPKRNLELFKQSWLRVTALYLALGLGLGISLGLVVGILQLIPFLGALLGPLAQAVALALVLPFFAMVSYRLYFQIRRKHEGGDPEGDARAELEA